MKINELTASQLLELKRREIEECADLGGSYDGSDPEKVYTSEDWWNAQNIIPDEWIKRKYATVEFNKDDFITI